MSYGAKQQPNFFVGVDLGQAQDYTAIAVVERIPAKEGPDGRPAGLVEQGTRSRTPIGSILHVRHLERLPLGMPYAGQAEHIRDLLRADELQTVRGTATLWGGLLVSDRTKTAPGVAVDATGVGRPACEMLRAHGLSFDAITITAGETHTYVDGFHRVPKRDLIAALQVSMESGWLRIAAGLELAETLRSELLNFRMKVNINTGHDSYEAWREGDHDDLVLATAMACWKATRRPRSSLVGSHPGY